MFTNPPLILSNDKCFVFLTFPLQTLLDDLRQSNAQLQDQNTVLRAQLGAGAMPVENSGQLVADERLKKLEEENQEKDAELERLRKDQEDLLELLTDQDTKLTSFKNRLRELGATIEDEDSESGCSENET